MTAAVARVKPSVVPLVLRPEYQVPAIDDLRAALRKHRRVLLVLPTGGGKTAIASFLAQEVAARRKPVYFNCHRTELVEQTSLTWSKYGIPHGFIASGRPTTLHMANVCSIDTLKNRLLTTPEPAVVIWDECHHLGAEGWQLIMDAWPNAIHIGLTATPWRMDGIGLGRFFQAMVQGPSSSWLMQHGFLSSYEIYAPNPPDMKGARRAGDGDYSKRSASAKMDMPKRTGDIVAHWRKYAYGLRTIAFAINRADSGLIVDRFNSNGIPFAHLDGDTPKGERKDIIGAYAHGELMGLSNVALFGEGFDLAAIAQVDNLTIDCLIDAAPSDSLSAVLQRWGRILRPKDYAAIILDHAGNSNRHGFPDDDRDWSLDDREKSGKGGKGDDGPPPPYNCKCFRQIKRPLPAKCPHCGIAIVPDYKPVKEGEDELSRRTADEKAAVRAKIKQEENDAKSLQDLIALANRRGYANPQGWAFKKYQASPWRKQLARERADAIGEAA